MALQYQLKKGNYHLYDLSTPASKVTGEHRLRLTTDTVVISGPLPVDEINKCLRITGYCGHMFSRLASLPHGKRLQHQH